MSEVIAPAPFSWSTVGQALKIFAVVVLFMAAQQGTQAFAKTFEWSNLVTAGEILKVFQAILMGCVFGAMDGVMRAVQILVAVWAGPTVWGYLGPVLGSAATLTANAAGSVVRALRGNSAKPEP